MTMTSLSPDTRGCRFLYHYLIIIDIVIYPRPTILYLDKKMMSNYWLELDRILIWPLEVPFFVFRKRPLLPKVPIFETKKMALRVAKSKF